MVRATTCLVSLLALLASCDQQPRTQLVVTIASDLPRTELELVRVMIVATDGTTPTGHEFDLSDRALPRTPLPFSFGIAPPGNDPTRTIELTVVGVGPGSPGPEVVRRVVRTGFIRGRTLLLRIALTAACRDLDCTGADRTCDGNACVPTTVDPGSLPNVEPGAEIGDAGAAISSDGGAIRDAPDAATSCVDLPPVIRSGSGSTTRPVAMTLVRNAPGQTLPLRLATVVGGELRLQTFSGDLATSITSAPSSVDPGVVEIEGASPAGASAYEWVGAFRSAAGLTLFDATTPGPTVHTAPLTAPASAVLPRGAVIEAAGTAYLVTQTAGSLSLLGLDLTGTSIGAGTSHPDILGGVAGPAVTSLGGGLAVADVTTDGHCRVTVMQTDGRVDATGTLTTDGGCSAPTIAQLAAGTLLVAYHLPPSGSPTPRVAFQVVDVSLRVVVSERSLGDASSLSGPIAVAPRLDGGAMIVWTAPLALAYVSLDTAGMPGLLRNVTAAGATSTDLATFRLVRSGDDRAAVAWIADSGVELGVLCDRP